MMWKKSKQPLFQWTGSIWQVFPAVFGNCQTEICLLHMPATGYVSAVQELLLNGRLIIASAGLESIC